MHREAHSQIEYLKRLHTNRVFLMSQGLSNGKISDLKNWVKQYHVVPQLNKAKVTFV